MTYLVVVVYSQEFDTDKIQVTMANEFCAFIGLRPESNVDRASDALCRVKS